MDKQTEHLETLTEIRSLMERSSRFISLSGLTGVFAGIFAILGAVVAYIYLDHFFGTPGYSEFAQPKYEISDLYFYIFFFADASTVLVLSLSAGVFFSVRKARKQGSSLWDPAAKRMILNLMIPLATGGLFCLILLYHGLIGLVAPATLIFYGLALLNAGKYTLNDIRYLGVCEIILGLLSSVYLGYGLIFWAFGFGVLHIIYGIIMYNKYDK